MKRVLSLQAMPRAALREEGEGDVYLSVLSVSTCGFSTISCWCATS